MKVLNAENVEIPITVRVKLPIPEDAPNAKVRNPLLPAPSFTIASFRSAKHSISHSRFAKEMNPFPLTNLPEDSPSDR